jgi:hypothetical protein
MGIGSFPGVKWMGRGAVLPLASSAEVTKWYSYTSNHPLGQFRPATGLLFLFIIIEAGNDNEMNCMFGC